VEYGEHVDAVERDTKALVDALRSGPLDMGVPSCPEWTLTELAHHIGGFTGFWSHVLCEGTGRSNTPFREMPSGPGVADWYEELADLLVAELRITPADTAVWTWVPDRQNAAFVARRCAHELAVHRFDAQLARRATQPIDAALAADGIEEIFVMIAAWSAQGDPAGRGQGRGDGESLHLHATDRGDEWLLTMEPEGLRVDRQHGKGDLALRGSVSDLELVLYQRPPIGEVEHLGDEAALAAWYRAFAFG
jgi:uncharacterized protein (TIGR03083 family)